MLLWIKGCSSDLVSFPKGVHDNSQEGQIEIEMGTKWVLLGKGKKELGRRAGTHCGQEQQRTQSDLRKPQEDRLISCLVPDTQRAGANPIRGGGRT